MWHLGWRHGGQAARTTEGYGRCGTVSWADRGYRDIELTHQSLAARSGRASDRCAPGAAEVPSAACAKPLGTTELGPERPPTERDTAAPVNVTVVDGAWDPQDMRSRGRAVMVISSGLLMLTSCGVGTGAGERSDVTEDSALSEAVDIASLQENSTRYLGDNSRVIALVDATGPEAVGEPTLELHTDHRPYGLVINFSSVAPGVTADTADGLMTDRAVLLMATIDNVDEIRWTLPERSGLGPDGSLSRAEADALVGFPVADLGTTEDDLKELVKRLEDA